MELRDAANIGLGASEEIIERGINVKTKPYPGRVRSERARKGRISPHPSQTALLIFGGMSVYMLVFYLLNKTAESLLGFLTLALGYAAYRLAGRTLPP